MLLVIILEKEMHHVPCFPWTMLMLIVTTSTMEVLPEIIRMVMTVNTTLAIKASVKSDSHIFNENGVTLSTSINGHHDNKNSDAPNFRFRWGELISSFCQ